MKLIDMEILLQRVNQLEDKLKGYQMSATSVITEVKKLINTSEILRPVRGIDEGPMSLQDVIDSIDKNAIYVIPLYEDAVWIECFTVVRRDHSLLVPGNPDKYIDTIFRLSLKDYGVTWLAYRDTPKDLVEVVSE